MQETWVQFLVREYPSGEGNDNPLQSSCVENPTDREAWEAPVHGVLKRAAEKQQSLDMVIYSCSPVFQRNKGVERQSLPLHSCLVSQVFYAHASKYVCLHVFYPLSYASLFSLSHTSYMSASEELPHSFATKFLIAWTIHHLFAQSPKDNHTQPVITSSAATNFVSEYVSKRCE